MADENVPGGGTPPSGQDTSTPPPAPAAPPAPPIPWMPGADEVTVGYFKNKGWTEPAQLFDAYRAAEKFISAPAERRLLIPGENATPEEVNKFYTQLGKPADPADYKIEVPELGGDPEFAKTAAGWFHKNNVPKAMAEGIVKEWNEHIRVQQEAFAQQQEARATAEVESLKQEWGQAFEQNKVIAQNAARGLKVPDAVVDALEKEIGLKATLQFFHSIGSKMGEAEFTSGDSRAGFGSALTPGQAKAKIQELTQDKEFFTRYMNGDVKAKEEMQRLHQFLAGSE